MQQRQLGKTGIAVTPIAFGSFKIGRNQKIKYPAEYDLPSDEEAERILSGVLDLGINYIDTAPAYGIAEERIGQFLEKDGRPCVVSTKVGETFAEGESCYDFSPAAVRESIARSRERLKRKSLDIVFVHSDGRDLEIQTETDVVALLQEFQTRGDIRAIGFSGKSVEGARHALQWADAIMVEHHCNDTSHTEVMHEAAACRVGVVVKKGLSAGHLPAAQAIRFVLSHSAVTSVVIGGLNLDHMRENVAVIDES